MSMENLENHIPEPGSRRAWGRRRMTPDSITGSIEARRFEGLPAELAKPHQLLGALKKARAQLGISVESVDLIDCLFSLTKPQDWQPGARPVVWPSNSFLAHELGISISALRKRVRRAIEERLLADRPSPNGKRYGSRLNGVIDQERSFGLDLSLIALRHAEFTEAAAKGRQLYQAAKAIQRRGYAAKTALLQLIETATEQRLWTSYWERIEAESEAHYPALRGLDQLAQLAHATNALEGLRSEAEAVLIHAMANQPEQGPEDVDSDSKGSADGPLNNYTNQLSESENTCRGMREGSRSPESPAPYPAADQSAEEDRFSPSVVCEAAPEVALYCRSAYPTWDDLADSARLVCPQVEISQRLWGRACQLLGRHGATMALAVMLHQHGRNPLRSPGGYFHRMLVKAEQGELDLRRSYYGMRSRLAPPVAPTRRAAYRAFS